MIPRDIAALTTKGVVVSVATRDAQLLPTSMVGLGVRVLDDGDRLAIFVAESWVGPTLANVRANGRIAVTFASPITFQTGQVKGRFLDYRPMTEDERAYQEAWKARVRQELMSAGHGRSAVVAMRLDATHVLTLETQDVFVQTPGPRAGERAT